VLLPRPQVTLARGPKTRSTLELNTAIAVAGIGKNSFHVVGLDKRGAIVLRQKWSRGQVEARFATMPPCLIGMEACVGAHHLSRKLKSLISIALAGFSGRLLANGAQWRGAFSIYYLLVA
jgi:transposase